MTITGIILTVMYFTINAWMERKFQHGTRGLDESGAQ